MVKESSSLKSNKEVKKAQLRNNKGVSLWDWDAVEDSYSKNYKHLSMMC